MRDFLRRVLTCPRVARTVWRLSEYTMANTLSWVQVPGGWEARLPHSGLDMGVRSFEQALGVKRYRVEWTESFDVIGWTTESKLDYARQVARGRACQLSTLLTGEGD